jgi:hypothetical protein
MNISFESKVCGRCNGTKTIRAYGHVMNGVCFGCGGSGTKATKNGAAAHKAFQEALTVEASELTVGNIIWTMGMDGKNRRVQVAEIKASELNSGMIEVNFTNKTLHIMEATTKVVMALSNTNKHLALAALENMKGVTITE